MRTLATDDFTRADNQVLGAPWSDISDLAGCKIVANAVRAALLDSYTAERYAGEWANDQWAEIILGSVLSSVVGSGPAVRAADTTQTLYLVMACTTQIKLRKLVDKVNTLLATYSGACAVGDVIRLEANGTTLNVLQNGINRISTTDASIGDGDPGVFCYEAVVGNGDIASWSAGDFEPTRAEKIDAIVAWEVAVQLANGLSQAEADAVGAATRTHLESQGDDQVENEYQRHPLGHSWILQL